MHLQHFIRTYPHSLPLPQCQAWCEGFASHQPTRNGAGVRLGLEASSWHEFDVAKQQPALVPSLEKLALQGFYRYNQDCGLTLPIHTPVRFSEWIIKRYRADQNEGFQYHFDALGPVANRYLVFLWYLNTVGQGGETVFPDIGVQIVPQAGTLLIFPPYWLFQHAGLPPISGDKYILSTYALY
jgi:hypothetical protein